MRRFLLNRRADYSGISGTGIVAEGIEFTQGKCALTWYGAVTSVAVYDSMNELLLIHGHGDSTTVEWIDNNHYDGRNRHTKATGQTPETTSK